MYRRRRRKTSGTSGETAMVKGACSPVADCQCCVSCPGPCNIVKGRADNVCAGPFDKDIQRFSMKTFNEYAAKFHVMIVDWSPTAGSFKNSTAINNSAAIMRTITDPFYDKNAPGKQFRARPWPIGKFVWSRVIRLIE